MLLARQHPKQSFLGSANQRAGEAGQRRGFRRMSSAYIASLLCQPTNGLYVELSTRAKHFQTQQTPLEAPGIPSGLRISNRLLDPGRRCPRATLTQHTARATSASCILFVSFSKSDASDNPAMFAFQCRGGVAHRRRRVAWPYGDLPVTFPSTGPASVYIFLRIVDCANGALCSDMGARALSRDLLKP